MNTCVEPGQISVTEANHGIRIVGYVDGLFTTSGGTNSIFPIWDGKFGFYLQNAGAGLFAWSPITDYSVPGLGGSGRSDIAQANVQNGASAGNPGNFYVAIIFLEAGEPGATVWYGKGPVDPGWSGIGPANTSQAAGVYTRFNNGPSNLVLPATVTLALF